MSPGGMSGSDTEPTAALPTEPTPGQAEEGRRPRRGSTLGRYLILKEIGSGGMGIVFSAYDPELDRKVALKLMRPARTGAPGSEGMRRLMREAQAMARLAHPNVIPVFDVGAFDEGVFVAMELVRGANLRHWLRERPREWKEVLRVFLSAGRGLQAAHEAGLVHRDFKPENVLVGDDDRVRVLDFGLAAFAGGGATSTPAISGLDHVESDGSGRLTETGAVLGSPPYMAPEQHDGQVADARSDQFSFCVALFEGLVGQRPFEGSTFDALALAKREQRFSETSERAPVPDWLRAAVRRGLRSIPGERWPSMEALLAELGRERGSRARRYALAAGVVGLALVLAALPSATVRQQAFVCETAADKLETAWNAERRAAVRAAFSASGAAYAPDALRRLEVWIDAYADEWAQARLDACEATHVHRSQSGAVLDLRMACLDARLAEVSAFLDVLVGADADVVARSVQAASHLPAAASCMDAESVTEGPVPDGVAAVRARVATATAHDLAGKYSDGLVIAEDAVAQARPLGYPPVEAEALFRLGRLRLQTGDAVAAEQALSEATWLAAAGRRDELAAKAATELVEAVGVRQSRYQDGRTWACHAEAAIRRAGPSLAAESHLVSNRAALLATEGRFTEAFAEHQRALSLREQAFGRVHPNVADSLTHIGVSLQQRERHAEALPYYERALAILEQTLGPKHPDVGATLNNLGLVFHSQGQLEGARRHLERGLEIRVLAAGSEHLDVAASPARRSRVARPRQARARGQ